MRIMTSPFGILGAVTGFYLGLYVAMAAGESLTVSPADTLLIAAPLLAIAGSIAAWFRPQLFRLTLWGATAAWLSFGVAIAGLNWFGGLGLRDVPASALLMIVCL